METTENLRKILDKNPSLCNIIKNLKVLKEDGYSNEKLEGAIQSMDLPIGNHLFIMGNFTNLMKFNFYKV